MGDLLRRYQSRIAEGVITPDVAQADAATRLDELASRLTRETGVFRKPKPETGLYLWGGVGRGKSMLMDMFFEAAQVRRKRRVHFHAFMRDTHAMLAAWRSMDEKARKRSKWRVRGNDPNVLAPVAKEIAASARLLCFDEFQVTQIADAMILGRLFEGLIERGVTIVVTSNRHPDELYKDGLNRQLFLPFIDMLKTQCDVFELAAERDYRLELLTGMPVWHAPLGDVATRAMDEPWNQLTMSAEPRAMTVDVAGRQIDVPRAGAGVARFGFQDLCARPLGASDYLAIAGEFHTLMIDDIPMLTPDRRSEAVRFISLIDALYETGTKLIASAAGEPDLLYPDGKGSFEFQRTASRLYEMRSKDYLARARVAPKA